MNDTIQLDGAVISEIELSASLSVDESLSTTIGEVVTIIEKDHNELENRNLPNQHTIDSITGLRYALDNISSDWANITNKPFSGIDSNTLTVSSGTLRVNTTDVAEHDNTKPITSSGVEVIVGNINVLLSQI